MSEADKVWVGADPGGAGNFGLAILAGDGTARTWCTNCADDAVTLVRERVSVPPAGVGVDAPLWWSSGCSGWRHADQWIRTTYGLSSGQVQAANSLRSAALVQGMMFVQRMRELCPAVPVTETHPKAVLKAIIVNDWSAFDRMSGLVDDISSRTDHERDAIISAVAAREGFEGRWTRDLSTQHYEFEQDPHRF